jgi:hypothetical protein
MLSESTMKDSIIVTHKLEKLFCDRSYVTEMEQEGGDGEKRRKRVLRNVVPSSEIFGHPTQNGVASYTWGVHDKICFATPKSVEVVQYSPYKDSSEERFTRLGEVDTNSLQGEIVNGDSASFGFIVESEGGLLVINSLMESMWLEGEPVNWRVFPKSKFYTNQLHVIYHDHLCIYSFNQDYFVLCGSEDQKGRYTPPQRVPFRWNRGIVVSCYAVNKGIHPTAQTADGG